MTSNQQLMTIRTSGIYHGLPTISESAQGLTAIVTGANGISGAHMIQVLCQNPTRWSKIYALSRRAPTQKFPAHVEHISIDLLQELSEIAQQLEAKGVRADYVFFFAYIQPEPGEEGGSIWSASETLVKVNKALLNNFLQGLAKASIMPKRILLQLGAKYYGLHLGPAAVPQEETDARFLAEPNFYYAQQDVLEGFCRKHGCTWTTTRLSFVLGASSDNSMNLCYALAVYAAVRKHLGQPLVFPADAACWDNLMALSSSTMNAYLAEWAVLTDGAANQSLNADDGSPFTWGRFWPRLAARFGIPWLGPDDSATSDGTEAEFRELAMPCSPPPRGWGPPGRIRFRFALAEWAQRPGVAEAWHEIAARDGLRDGDLGSIHRHFAFADAALLTPWPVCYSDTKVRKLGFFGFVDSAESIFSVLDDLAALNMVPRI